MGTSQHPLPLRISQLPMSTTPPQQLCMTSSSHSAPHPLDATFISSFPAEHQNRPGPLKSPNRIAPRVAEIDAGAMGSFAAAEGGDGLRARLLCLHGFRTSAEIMRQQVVAKWPRHVTSRLDLVFADAPFAAEGKSDVDGLFPPPYYEWFQFEKGFMEYRNFDECLAYVEDLMIKHGPFDGLMGFSQGAILSAALPGMQAKGLALTRVSKLKCVVIIGGAKFPSPAVAEKAYEPKVDIPSLHIIGEMDFMKKPGEALLECFVDPFVIRHPKGHTVPRLDDKSLETLMDFLQRIEKNVAGDEPKEENKEFFV